MNQNEIVSIESNSDRNEIFVSDEAPAQHDFEAIKSRANLELVIEMQEQYPELKYRSPLDLSKSLSTPEFLIEDTIVANQPCVIAAAYKSMKTTLAIIIALSLATGRNFLGVYPIPKPRRVLLMCGESGRSKVQSTMAAWLNTNNLSFDAVDQKLWVTTEVPNFMDLNTLVAVESQLDIYQPEVVILDPLYLTLNDEQASIINNGRQLKQLSQPYSERGITFICVDHFRVTTRERRTPTLQSLSGAGKAAFFRQWILMNRSGKFSGGPQRRHKFNMSIGGSEGHFWENQIEMVEEFEQNRLTRLTCMIPPNADSDPQRVSDQGLSEKERREQEEHRRNDEAKHQISQLLRDLPSDGLLLQTELRKRLGLPNSLCAQVLDALVEEGKVVKQLEPKPRRNGRMYEGYRLTPIPTNDSTSS